MLYESYCLQLITRTPLKHEARHKHADSSHWAPRVDLEVNGLGGHQTSLAPFISLQGSNAGISTPVAAIVDRLWARCVLLDLRLVMDGFAGSKGARTEQQVGPRATTR
jgi:hypothetical protein